ncbi:MAG TPA: hypothetical protein VI251_18845 [Pseudolabrys sp.]
MFVLALSMFMFMRVVVIMAMRMIMVVRVIMTFMVLMAGIGVMMFGIVRVDMSVVGVQAFVFRALMRLRGNGGVEPGVVDDLALDSLTIAAAA